MRQRSKITGFQNKYSNLLLYSTAFCSVFILLWLFFYLNSYAPFGGNSMAWSDADIQYLDFFAYFKDVLAGRNDIGYTFSKELGGTNIGTYSYYLASPFHLLVIFFPKTELHTFFDLLVSLKLSTAAVTCAFFFRHRFSEKLQAKYIILLSVAYALMQYNIAQCSNMMWLDGVYMLPLILLGVYKLVATNHLYFLSISVGLAIIFNWYSAGADCLFAILWLFFEMFFVNDNMEHVERKIRTYFGKVIWFGYAMIMGIVLSAVLFFPTVFAMKGSGEGTFDWDLVQNEFLGDPMSAIQNYTLGATSSQGSVALFCGSLAVIGCVCFFFSKRIQIKRKLVAGIMLCVSVMCFYWKPLAVTFSLFKQVDSYWYRYSYVAIFLILFLAGCFFEKSENEEIEMPYLFLKCSIMFTALLLILNYANPVWNTKYVYTTAAFLLITGVLLEWPSLVNSKKKAKVISAASVLLAGVVVIELFANLHLLTGYYRVSNVQTFKDYTAQAVEQTERIQQYDSGTYRISQTATRNMGENGVTAYYNGAMAYNYKSITEYTSAPDGRQMDFLTRLGYRCEGINMQIVNTSVLGADSLLGVKYILSPYTINGLEPVEELGRYNGKTVYENPYSLPMAFVYDSTESGTNTEYTNPFEYQNELFAELAGEQVEIYQKLNFERNESNNTYTYVVDVPEGNYALYGNLPWNSTMSAGIGINGEKEFAYASWLSPSVFYIPSDHVDKQVTVTLTAATMDLSDEQFYALNLDELERVTQMISQGEVEDLQMKNGYVSCAVEAEKNERLFLSVPYHEGWTILLNGEEIEPELFGDCLISIPLTDGTNQVEMVYHVPMLKTGAVVSCAGIFILGFSAVYRKKKRKLKGKVLERS